MRQIARDHRRDLAWAFFSELAIVQRALIRLYDLQARFVLSGTVVLPSCHVTFKPQIICQQ